MEDIEVLRAAIKKIDTEIIRLLFDRKLTAQQIGKIKKDAHRDICDVEREVYLMSFYVDMASQYELDVDFLKQVFGLIIENAKKLQE